MLVLQVLMSCLSIYGIAEAMSLETKWVFFVVFSNMSQKEVCIKNKKYFSVENKLEHQ